MRLIDADALKEELNQTEHDGTIRRYVYSVIAEVLDNAPTIEAEPVRRGKWTDENCSECGQYVYHGDARRYCPNCGAKMEDADD